MTTIKVPSKLPKSKRRLSNSMKSEENIRVAVRVRPFNAREKKKGVKLCVQMDGQKLLLTNPTDGRSKKFAFDYCYWSHNNNGNYATQQTVFKDLGSFYVDNCINGYNSSVFAYGQTGSGKTYTMLGTGKNPGLIPRGCEELFRRISKYYSKKNNDSTTIEVEASYLEVYQDRIFDLLSKPDPKKSRRVGMERTKLPIRFHPKKGAYVEGLTRHGVASYRDVQKLMNVGLANRTVAETQMNKISSRSHCIFTLYANIYTETKVLTSKINLIDLAGSERVNKTGAVGQRMEELKKINKSLSALGDVISALSQNAKFVPYNNSVLTTLLRESLGGNSKTIMMAAISPSDDNFDETMSTLRYAARVKKIKTIAKQNRGDSKQSQEKELKAQINKLKKQLELRSGKGQVQTLENQLQASQEELRRVRMQHSQKVQEMHKAYDVMVERLKKMGLTIEDFEKKDTKDIPKLINLNADPSLSGTMVFFLTKDEMRIGTEIEKKFTPEILLIDDDTAIQAHHATIRISRTRVDVREKARDFRRDVFKFLFDESDLNKNKYLTLDEFNIWAKQVIKHDENFFNGFSEGEFNNLCKKYNEDPLLGLTLKSLLTEFDKSGMNDDEKTSNDNKLQRNLCIVGGIPKKQVNNKLLQDLKDFVFEDHDTQKIQLKSNRIIVTFNYDIDDKDIKSIEQELKNLFKKTTYGQKINFRRYEASSDKKKKQKFVEELKTVIENADPSNERLMIFVNGDRVRFDPKVISHGDHILLGNRHLFQLVTPIEAMETGMGKKVREKDLQEMNKFLNTELELFKNGINTISQFGNLLNNRMKNELFSEKNIDVKTLKEQLLAQRELSALGGDSSGLNKVNDGFMQDYRIISEKTNHANTMALELNKQVLFNVNTIHYFDIKNNCQAERMMITRECHYSLPELQHQMPPPQFEEMLKNLTRYYKLAKKDGEEIAQETMDDDPFVPQEIDTCYGEAKFKLTGRKIEKSLYKIPIIRPMDTDQVGMLTLEITFKLINDNLKNCYDFKKMENKQVKMVIDIIKVELALECSRINISFCAIGDKIQNYTQKSPQEDYPVDTFESFDAYQVSKLKLTPSFRNWFGSSGITFKIFVPVFEDLNSMPPIIAHKLSSTKINITVKVSGGDEFSFGVKTGNTIGSLKRKIDFITEIADDTQTLIYDKTTLENHRTLLDYGIKDGSIILVMVANYNRRKSVDLESYDEVTSLKDNNSNNSHKKRRSKPSLQSGLSLLKLSSMDSQNSPISEKDENGNIITLPQKYQQALSKELKNPNLSVDEKSRLRRKKNRSIHLAMVEVDKLTTTTMTVESYQVENQKLRDQLNIANKKIDMLETKISHLEQQIGQKSIGKKKNSRFFGKWGKS